MKRIMVFGASGGIGSALCQILSEDPEVSHIYAGGRQHNIPRGDKITSFYFDLTEESTIKDAMIMARTDGPLDMVLVMTGILEDQTAPKAEKSIRDLVPVALGHYFATNTIGPMIVAKHACTVLDKERPFIFGALSARVGSIQDNELGGWYGYRASKAALNMMIKTTALEMARRYRHAVFVGLHPGTVKTALSQRYLRNVQHEIFSPEQSAGYLYEVAKSRLPEHSGKVFAWDGSEIKA